VTLSQHLTACHEADALLRGIFAYHVTVGTHGWVGDVRRHVYDVPESVAVVPRQSCSRGNVLARSLLCSSTVLAWERSSWDQGSSALHPRL
jgi:hypothetical protein